MIVYIPAHLEKLEIVAQLSAMIKGYSDYYEETKSSFEDYYYMLKTDSVKKFLKVCLKEEDFQGSDNEYEEVINYLCRLFYSVKGTIKVFDYMKKYLNLKFQSDIVYTVNSIELKIDTTDTKDINLFYNSLKGFLDALLYYQELVMSIGILNLILGGYISSSISKGCLTYKTYTPTKA